MSDTVKIPEFAVIGHPNEGKSSLVSTLSEDDTVKVSPYPGETVKCRSFSVIIDGRETVRFTDTPGFQSPKQALNWFEKTENTGLSGIRSFIDEHRKTDLFRDECELFSPLAREAIIIFVVDGSRPVRSNDRTEMAILKHTGLPRMAVINHKTDNDEYTGTWKKELSNHFPFVTVFNAHFASYGERIRLLSEFSQLLPENRKDLETVIDAFKKEWRRRNLLTADHILNLLEKALSHTVKITVDEKAQKEQEKGKAQSTWASQIRKIEKDAHQSIRTIFKHNIFNFDLPAHNLSSIDLFDKETWKLLGMTRKELIASSAALGAATAATIDLALIGHSLGLFTLAGGLAGAGSAIWGAKKIGSARILGKTLGSYTLKVGPQHDLQFMMVLLDRAFIFYSHIINWAHGRRPDEEYERAKHEAGGKQGFVNELPKNEREKLVSFFNSIGNKKEKHDESVRKAAFDAVLYVLDRISVK